MPSTPSQELQALRVAVAALRAEAQGRRRKFPQTIRQQAVTLLQQGTSVASLARGTGLRKDLLQKWRAAAAEPTAEPRPAPRVFGIDSPLPSASPLCLQLGAFVITVALVEGGR